MFSHHDVYVDNIFTQNRSGVAVMFSKFITMRGNRFEQNWGDASYGLLLKEIYDGTLSRNAFINNTIAIYAEGATRVRIDSNVFLRNGWAMTVLGSAVSNTVEDNTFIDNNFDVSTNTRTSENHYARNYWSKYKGYDLNRDGWGDVPFRPVSLYSYVIERVPESIILLKSLFVDILGIAEKIMPSFSPQTLLDNQPRMYPPIYDKD